MAERKTELTGTGMKTEGGEKPNVDLWAVYKDVHRRVCAIDPVLAAEFDRAAMDIKEAEVDQARLEGIAGLTMSGELVFDWPDFSGGQATIHFTPVSEATS